MLNFRLGLDDTDNPEGGCTTYTLTKIIDALSKKDPKFTLLDFPKLIRLNPNVPYKTRGNGALALHGQTNLSLKEVEKIVQQIIEKDTSTWQKDSRTEPSYILIDEKDVIENSEFYWSALRSLKHPDEITSLLKNSKHWSRNDNRSLVGSYAAIIADLSEDFTYELIAYRKPENYGRKREFNEKSLKSQIMENRDMLFSNYDFIEDRELIAPSGPDPVFCGIRGEDPRILVQVFKNLDIAESLEGYTIFKTNQGTGHHLKRPHHSFLPNSVHTGTYRLRENPMILKGGHVKLKCRDVYKARSVDLMVFEPTKTIVKTAQKLRKDDIIHILGGVKQNDFGISIAVEELFVIHLAEQIKIEPPICINCNKRMTSAGRFKGYKCRNCGYKMMAGIPKKQKRPKITAFSRLLPVASAQRHLTKPYERYGRKPVTISPHHLKDVRVIF